MGLSLIEILVAVAVVGILSGVAVISLTGFLTGGKEDAYAGERETLQTAVTAWRNTTGKTVGPRFPLLQSGDNLACLGKLDASGNPSVPGCNPYIDMKVLAERGFIKSGDAVKSADTSRNTTATNKISGNYGWFVATGGLVASYPVFQPDVFP